MKYKFKKMKAFTLAEIMIVIAIVSIVTVVTIIHYSPKSTLVNKIDYYYTFINLKQAVAELFVDGCTSTDVSKSYCVCTSTLPTVSHTTDNRGFCDRLVEKINTVGTVNCAATGATTTANFTDTYLNFSLPSGARYFNFNTSALFAPYTVYVDIDGTKGDHVLGKDVLPFTVSPSDGTVYPYYSPSDATSSIGATSTNYLSANVKYTDSTGYYVWADQNVDYYTAVCDATGSYGVGISCTKKAVCSTNNCEVVLNKPAFKY